MRYVGSALLWLALAPSLAPVLADGPSAPAAAPAELALAHEQLWDELRTAAVTTAVRFGPPPRDATHEQAFAQLGGIARDLAGRRTLLLLDPFGDVVVWGGAGLLHTVSAERLRTLPCGFEQSAASVTLWCVGRLAGDGNGWSLLAGESFERYEEAPLAIGARGRFRGGAWGLAPSPDASRPSRLAAEGVALASRGFGRDLWLRTGSAVLALLLAARALARRGTVGWFLLASAIGFAFVAAGGAPLPSLAAGAGAFLAALAGETPRRTLRGGGIAAAAAVGPLLFTWQARSDAPFDAAGQILFGGADLAALRLASSLLVLAAIRAGAAALSENGSTGGGWMAAAVTAALAGAFVGPPVATAVFVAAAGLAAAIGLARLGARRATPLGLALPAPALVAGAAASTAHWHRLRRVAPAQVERLLPPRFQEMRERIGEIEPLLEKVALAMLARTPGAAPPPADLAYAIWRDSPLARRDALTALAVGRAGVAPSTFSYGLPIDKSGLLDPAPVRWVELDPHAWRERAIAGELETVGADGARWRLRWSLVPRPGFGEPAPPVGDLARGLLRGGAANLWLTEVTDGLRAVLYDDALEPRVTPWSEGTPEFDPAWLDPTRRSPRAMTPDGPAIPFAERSEGVTAAIFVPVLRPSVAIESVGSFAAGTLLLVAGGVGLWLFATLRPAGTAAALRRLLRSYSQRLVLVFSVLVLVPTVLLYALLASALERRLEREQESRAHEALHSAQRVLGEYVLSLDPGFGVDTALDDRLLEWLARVVRHEVNLYWGSGIYASSKRELFAAGLLPSRIPGEIWERIALAGVPFARRTASAGRRDYLELYAPLEVPGEISRQLKLVLALPLLAQQEELEAEVARVRRRALLGALALFGLLAATGVVLARSFARPIQDLVAGTRRIADGAAELGFRPEERELESLALAIDQMAARIAEGRARLLSEKGLVERIVENVTAAVVGLDREGRVLLANRFARERLGAAPGESLRAGFVSAGLGALANAFDSARPGVEAVATPAFGESDRNWSLVRVPLGSGDPAELVVVEDVTDVSRAQRLEAWAAMARIIAHEIKNPLTPIRLSTEHLREAWARDRVHFEAVFERCTENILAQVEELRRTASEFSLYSEIPRIEKQPEDLGAIVAEIVEAYRAAPPAGVEIHFARSVEPAVAGVDRRLIGRAVRNLIENALRAQPAGGEVEVETGSGDGRVFVRVADRGPGVPPELLERILEPYFSTQAGGTGLGLPIARRVALEHGGELAVRNRTDGGFDVTITIPA